MLKITAQNYEFYKKVFCLMWEHYHAQLPVKLSNTLSPIQAMEQLELKSKAIARSSLKVGLSDMVAMIAYAPQDFKGNINKELIANGLPGLNKIIVEIRDVVSKVIKRGRIKDLDEYYIIKEFVDDMDSDISEEERISLNELFFAFEQKPKEKK